MRYPTLLWLLWLTALPLPAHAATCQLHLRSQPSKAKVYLDGKLIGRTPLIRRKQKAGQLLLSFVYKGRVTIDRLLKCPRGKTTRLRVKLYKTRADLTLTSTPTKARVWIDGRPKGHTPLSLSLPAGQHSIQLRLYKHKTLRTKLQLRNKQRRKLHLKLERQDGQLVVLSTPPGAFVYNGAKFLGKTPLRRRVPGGQYTIILHKKGLPLLSRSITVPSMGATTARFSFQLQIKLSSTAISQMKKTYKRAQRRLKQAAKRGAKRHPGAARNTSIEIQIQGTKNKLVAAKRPQDKLALRLYLRKLYRDAKRHFRAKGFAYNDKRNTKAWPRAKAAQGRVWEIADFYKTMELLTISQLLTQANLSLALRCRLRYAEGLALRRNKDKAARYSFYLLANNPKFIRCKEKGPAYTRMALSYIPPLSPAELRLVPRLFQRALSYKSHGTYALALYGYGRFLKRDFNYKKALPLFARCLRQTHRKKGVIESELLRVTLLLNCRLEVILAYHRVGNPIHAKQYFLKWGGKEHYLRMLQEYRRFTQMSRFLRRPHRKQRRRKAR